jgi:hypothetical protein
MRRSIRVLPGLTALLALTALADPSYAQERLRDYRDGDGRIHGAPTLPVVEQDLHPGQVQTLNLSVNMHSVLEFPYPVAKIHAGDPSLLTAAIEGNKVILKSTRVTRAETNLSIILGDADFTVVPFLVRTDELQPVVFLVRFTDPLARHLVQVEADIAGRLSATMDQRVSDLAEARLRQRLLYAGQPQELNRSATARRGSDRLNVRLIGLIEVPETGGEGQSYLRYRIINQTIQPITDLHFVLRIVEKKRRWIFFEKETQREVYDVVDVRTAESVPAGMTANGLLVLPTPDLRYGSSLRIEFSAAAGAFTGSFDRVLSGTQ